MQITETNKSNNSLFNQSKHGLSLIQKIAYASLKEATASSLMIGVSCCFTATPSIPLFLIPMVLNIAYQGISMIINDSLKEMNNDSSHDKEKIKQIDAVSKLLQFLSPFTFSIIDLTTTSTLIHEAGHAFAASSVYQHANPKIEIFPLTGGVTKFSITPLTKFGQLLGAKSSRLLVTAAGPIAGVCAATIQIGLSHRLKKDYPKLASYLQAMGITTVAQHVIYALSALWQTSPRKGHDFVALWKLGNIHPIVSVICLIALPLLVTGLCILSEKKRHASESAQF